MLSNKDLGATIASGSHDCEAMVIVPCSMKTLAGVAHGLSRNLVERAADVMLKEKRRLVIVPREAPMSLPQLKNMVLCAEAGAMILPAMPAFYQMPKTLDDLADFMAGKILSGARLLRTRCIRSGKAERAARQRLTDRRARRGERRARGRVAIRIDVPARPRVDDAGVIAFGGQSSPGRAIAGDEREHDAVAVADVEEPQRVPDLVQGHRTRDLVAAARADVVIQVDRAGLAPTNDDRRRSLAGSRRMSTLIQPVACGRTAVPVSIAAAENVPPVKAGTARRSASSVTASTSGSTGRPFWSTVRT